jgi:hypothetical protein
MKLADLNPRWAIDADIVVGGQSIHNEHREGMAISFDCPHCRETRLAVFFSNPIDGGLPSDDGKLWERRGDDFDTLTLSLSVDASASGHWHGHITDGEIK